MEARALVTKAVLTGAELAEIFRSFGHDVVVELEGDAACMLTADANIELRAAARAWCADKHR